MTMLAVSARLHPLGRIGRIGLSALLVLAAGLGAAPARALEQPTGKVVLTVSGTLTTPNRGDHAVFDMAMLAKLPQHSFSTKTPWYPGPRKFTGPLLRDVLAAAGAQGTTIEALALNDYKVTIPLEDARLHPVLLARLIDEQPMAVRDKGPLFIIYPFDADPQLNNTVYFSRSAWQVKALSIR